MANSFGSRPSGQGLFGASTSTPPSPSRPLFGASTPTIAPSSRPSAPSLFGGSTPTGPLTKSTASATSGFGTATSGLGAATSRFGAATPPLPSSTELKKQRKLSFVDALKTYQPGTSDAHADFTIVCSGREFKVHRIILAAHSKYFKRLFDGHFREVSEQKVTLQDDSLAAVQRMISYCYNFSLFVSDKDPSTHLNSYSVLFALADKYDMPGLKELALEDFQFCAQVARPTSLFSGKYADAPSLAVAMVKAVPHIYQNTPATDDRLRTFVTHRFLQNDKELLKLCEKKAFDEMLLEVPEFACDLIPALTGIQMKVVDDDKGPGGEAK